MGLNVKILFVLKKKPIFLQLFRNPIIKRNYHEIPILDLYQKTTGETVSKDFITRLRRKHKNICELNHEHLQYTLQILDNFGITPLEACNNLHLFCMKPIAMDNYGQILKECRFIHLSPINILRYHTLVRKRTIEKLKKDGFIKVDSNIEEVLLDCLQDWPSSSKFLLNFSDANSSILTVRLSVLERYLNWRLDVSSEEFKKYCRHYLPLKHKPMSDIQEALNIAQKEFNFDKQTIKRNGFVISSDPINTKLIIDNVPSLAKLDIREVIRIEPAILKNNYNSVRQIRDLLEEYRIPNVAIRSCFKIFCMCPKTVQERLNELTNLKEYKILSTNPRVLSMVIHKKKVINRLTKIEAAKKQCYSLNNLIASNHIFNNYINGFGNKACGRDIAILISSSLDVTRYDNNTIGNIKRMDKIKIVQNHLKKHKYWLHTALNVVHENLEYLKENFNDDVILNNCQILLYPALEVRHYIDYLLKMRNGEKHFELQSDVDHHSNLNHTKLTDNHLLSLVLYEIEKKYHFSGDGIWSRHDGRREKSQGLI